MKEMMGHMDILSAFNVAINVPMLTSEDIRKVLQVLDVFSPEEVEQAVNVVAGEMPIKKLLMLVEMSKQGGSDQGASGKIDLVRFEECYMDLAQ